MRLCHSPFDVLIILKVVLVVKGSPFVSDVSLPLHKPPRPLRLSGDFLTPSLVDTVSHDTDVLSTSVGRLKFGSTISYT